MFFGLVQVGALVLTAVSCNVIDPGCFWKGFIHPAASQISGNGDFFSEGQTLRQPLGHSECAVFAFSNALTKAKWMHSNAIGLLLLDH